MDPVVQQYGVVSSVSTTRDQTAYVSFRILLGAIWLLNAWFHMSAWLLVPHGQAARNLLHAFTQPVAGSPVWLQHYLMAVIHGIDALEPSAVAIGMVIVDLLLALSLLSGIRVRFFCWLGIAYSLFCWTTLDSLGFPYVHGQTDPGVFVNYMLAFFFVLGAQSMMDSRAGTHIETGRVGPFAAGRILFGALWAVDAILKWQPSFLTHFMEQLTLAAQGQPAWNAAFMQFVITIIHFIGPFPLAIVVAVMETLIAASLLTGRWLKISVPIGLFYSLAVWATGEDWGGPYNAAGTGIRGDVIGNAIIYVFIFLYLWVAIKPLSPSRTVPGN